jgi:diguanylate cyclase
LQVGKEFEKAVATAGTAIARMTDAGVPPTPANFMVWYAYAEGAHPQLRQSLDTLLKEEQRFTPEINRRLFERFFDSTEDSDKVLEAGNQIGNAVNGVMGLLQAAGDSADKYGQVLDTFSGQLETGNPNDFGQVVAGVLNRTRKMQELNSVLQERLTESSNEIQQLREDLQKLQAEAQTDPLTGIGNRKRFDNVLSELAKHTDINRTAFCLVIADIDHFKNFNDSYGHQLGDQVLRLFARTLVDTIKGRDVAARYGGEEFAVLLPDTTLANAARVADDIRQSIADKRLARRTTQEQLPAITVSLGVAQYQPGEGPDLIVRRADEALYAAKQGGRNQVATERDTSPSRT